MSTVPSEALIALTKRQEGMALNAYYDVDGERVLGYGCKIFDGKPVAAGQCCTPEDADRNVRAHLALIAKQVLSLVGHPLTQGQLDALCDFAFNTGIAALRSSAIIRALHNKQPVTADMFLRWNKIHDAKGVLVEMPALTRRRADEWAMWTSNV